MPTKKIVNTMSVTKGNQFFGTGSSTKTNPVKSPKSLRPITRYALHLVTFHGIDTLINNYENIAAARRSMLAATESNLPHYRKCSFELVRLADDVVIQTAKHKSLLK